MACFPRSSAPVLTGMLKCRTKERLIPEIERIRKEGARAVGLQYEVLLPSEKSQTTLRTLFSCIGDIPIYFTDYMRSNSTVGITWEDIEGELITALSLGARLIDVPGDMYLSSDMELTRDRAAVFKQKSLISSIHSMGGEALMSSHVLKFVSKSTVLAIADEHFSRGADVSKIVTEANSEAELRENFEISLALAERYGSKTVFLCNGSYARRHRLFAPTLGSFMYLAAENALVSQMQPTLSEASEILKLSLGDVL